MDERLAPKAVSSSERGTSGKDNVVLTSTITGKATTEGPTRCGMHGDNLVSTHKIRSCAIHLAHLQQWCE